MSAPTPTASLTRRAGLGLAALALATLLGFGAAAQNSQTAAGVQKSGPLVDPTRGAVPASENNAAPDLIRQDIRDGGFDRAYRQQPPLIPHKIDRYQISVSTNQCMDCHDWPNNVAQKAPKISETHYQDRTGVKLDKVAGTRWFCTSCHVPQENAKALVGNSFTNATQTTPR